MGEKKFWTVFTGERRAAKISMRPAELAPNYRAAEQTITFYCSGFFSAFSACVEDGVVGRSFVRIVASAYNKGFFWPNFSPCRSVSERLTQFFLGEIRPSPLHHPISVGKSARLSPQN